MRKISLSIGQKHQTGKVENLKLTWPEFVKRCSETKVTSETFEEYLNSKKKRQSIIKASNGYFIGGPSIDGSRKRDSITYRDLLTLDIDHGVKGIEKKIKETYSDFEYCIYSTHKHSPEAPRIRLIIPLAESIVWDDYESLARQVADDLGMDYFDDTTYQHSRIMFWPTTAKDAEFVFYHNKGELLDPEEFAPFDVWPKSSRELDKPSRRNVKQVEDPRMKNGIIGAFCREYTIPEVIDEFLSHIYEETTSPDRYSYVHGSTTGGAIVYDDETILFSQHESDPAHGSSVNAFDLVRIHLVGKDATLKDMESWISQNAIDIINEARAEAMANDFEDDVEEDESNSDDFDRLISAIENSQDDVVLFDKVLKQMAFARLTDLQLDRLLTKFMDKAKELNEPIGKRALVKEIKDLQALSTTGEGGLVLSAEQELMMSNYVVIESLEKIIKLNNSRFISTRLFRDKYSRILDDSNPLAALYECKGIKVCDDVASSPKEKMFFKKNDVRYFNTYRPVRVKPRAGDVTPLLDHVAYILEDEYEQNILLDFIAYMVQNPGHKIRWMPVIKGGMGIGKTMFAEQVIFAVLGEYNVNITDAKQVYDDSKDGAWKISHQLIIFNELDCGSYKQRFANDMKSFVTDSKISVRKMHIGSDSHENNTNAIGFTNSENALILTAKDRRYCMMESHAIERKPSYYDKLVKWFKANHAQMLHFFKTRDISSFNPNRVPVTAYTEEIKAESVHWINQLLLDGVEGREWPFNVQFIKYVDIENYLIARKPDSAFAHELKSSKIAIHLKEVGFTPYRRPGKKFHKVKIEGELHKVWMMPDVDRKQAYKLPLSEVQQIIIDNKLEEDFAD